MSYYDKRNASLRKRVSVADLQRGKATYVEQLRLAEYQLSLHRFGERAPSTLEQRITNLRTAIKNYDNLINMRSVK